MIAEISLFYSLKKRGEKVLTAIFFLLKSTCGIIFMHRPQYIDIESKDS